MNAAPVLRMEDLLGSLGREEDHKEREFDVERNPVVDEMCRSFEVVIENSHQGYFEVYSKCKRNVPATYAAKDVEQFSLAFAKYNNRTLYDLVGGLYLSALVNNCPDTKVTLITAHQELDFLGYQNNGHSIIIRGSAGKSLGSHMSKGKIIVQDTVGKETAWNLKGGVIRIHGELQGLDNYIAGGDIYHKGVQIIKDGKRV